MHVSGHISPRLINNRRRLANILYTAWYSSWRGDERGNVSWGDNALAKSNFTAKVQNASKHGASGGGLLKLAVLATI